MKTISYQIEGRTDAAAAWQQLKPTVESEAEALTLLAANRIKGRVERPKCEYRLVKTVRTVVRA